MTPGSSGARCARAPAFRAPARSRALARGSSRRRGALMSTLQSSPFSPTVFASLPASGIRSGHSFPSRSHPRAATVFLAVTLFLPPVAVGAVRRHSGMLQAERRGSTARSTTRPDFCPVRLAGGRRPRDHNAHSGGATFREAGPICKNGAAVCGEPSVPPVTRLARIPRRPRRAARVS